MEQNNSEKQIKKVRNRLRMCLNRLKISQYWLFMVLRHLAKNCEINGKGMPVLDQRQVSIEKKGFHLFRLYYCLQPLRVVLWNIWGVQLKILKPNWEYEHLIQFLFFQFLQTPESVNRNTELPTTYFFKFLVYIY